MKFSLWFLLLISGSTFGQVLAPGSMATLMMYWGYFSFAGLLFTAVCCMPSLLREKDTRTPYQQRQDYFYHKKRKYEQSTSTGNNSTGHSN